jgi:hypothetical protein
VKAVGLCPHRPTKIGQAHAKVLEGLGSGAVGPEEAGQPGAFGVATGAQGKEGEKPLSLSGAQTREGLPVDPCFKGPEEANLQRRCIWMSAGTMN